MSVVTCRWLYQSRHTIISRDMKSPTFFTFLYIYRVEVLKSRVSKKVGNKVGLFSDYYKFRNDCPNPKNKEKQGKVKYH